MKDTTNYSVYLIKLDGVVMYVGKTTNFERRKSEHLHRIGTAFHGAIPEGTDLTKVSFIKVKEFNDKVEALKYEDDLILQYDTIHSGWNKQRSGLISIEDSKAYNKEKNEKSKDYMKKWREENRDEVKAYKKRWNEENKDEVIAYRKRYNDEHRDEVRAAVRKYGETHKEEKKAYMREYYKKRKLKKEEQN